MNIRFLTSSLVLAVTAALVVAIKELRPGDSTEASDEARHPKPSAAKRQYQTARRTSSTSPPGIIKPSPPGFQEVQVLPTSPAFSAAAVDEVLASLVASGDLVSEKVAAVGQIYDETVNAARQLLRASRIVNELPEDQARVYDFPPSPHSFADTRKQMADQVTALAGTKAANALAAMLDEAALADPSMDLGRHHRRIILQPSDSSNGWMATDETFSTTGSVIASQTVYLSSDDDGQLVWPGEYHVLLGDQQRVQHQRDPPP